MSPDTSDMRPAKQLREHYEIEKGLAEKIRAAPKNERATLYTTVYEELFRLVPHHQQLTRKISPLRQERSIRNKLKLLRRFLRKDVTFLEIGPGDCALAFRVCGLVRTVYAVDVSETITGHLRYPENFQLRISDGTSVPVPKASIDVAFSNQLMEHLHPEDAVDQLKNILASLVPGGLYLCITPNRIFGPHDISKHFDDVATGLHLREYSVSELAGLFKTVGFSRVSVYLGGLGTYVKFPLFLVTWCEAVLQLIPSRIRKKWASAYVAKAVIPIRIAGFKSGRSRP